MNNTLATVAAALGVVASSSLSACTCIKPDYFVEQDEWALKVFSKAEFIAHVKVQGLLPGNRASIRIVEPFKGDPQVSQVQGLVAPGAACGVTFTPDEEAVFMVIDGTVSLCDKFPVSPEFIGALRVISKSQSGHRAK